MKKLLPLLVWVAGAWTHAFAQTNIDAMEYFFDSDPGFGNGVSIPVAAAASQNINLSISTSSLPVGFHTLIIRAKHQSGSWGVQDSRVFYVASQSVTTNAVINEMEYYIDTDPGFGSGTPISISASTALNILPTISTSSLSVGFHVLHIRAKDVDGNWGIRETRVFYVVPGNVNAQAIVTQLEYFFDTEPGYGAGIPLAVIAGTQINFPALINSAALPNGFHTISVRAKDNDDQWGFAETRSFYVDQFSQVSAIEYFVDTDPGDGSATNIPIPPSGSVDLNFTVPTSGLDGGSHTFGVRAARTDGSWGSTSTTTFSVLESQSITFNAFTTSTYGDAPITLTGMSSSGLPLTYSSSNPLVATISGSTVTIVGAGTTTITASQAGNGSYAPAADITQMLVVNKADQSITFDALAPKGAGDPPFAINATSTSTLDIVFNSSNTSVATVAGNLVTIVGEGTTGIIASQPGNGNYNAATDVVQSLVVLPVNNPPTLSVNSGSVFFINEPLTIDNTIAVTDPEDVLESASVAIVAGFQNGEDQLLFTAQPGLTAAYNATSGTLAITGAASAGDYQAILRSVQYNNTSLSPNTADRTIAITVTDGTTTAGPFQVTVSINKPPAITATPRDIPAGGNFVFIVGNILSDPDGNLDLSTLNVVSKQGATITIVGNVITVNYSTMPDYQGVDELTITVCDQGGQCETQVVTVDVSADVEVFNGISANEDGMNDFMKVKFLPTGSRVTIFNRWGDPVYENKDYDSNDPEKRFDGSDLNAGTYFYTITLPDGRKRSGYLQLKKQ